MATANNLKLELVQVLFRHGARTYTISEATIPMPQYIDQSLQETYGYEQLTNTGKAQAYNLGCVLRNRYDDFLGPTYKLDDVYAYSSDYDRTKMSLQLVLAGLYPPAPEQTWNEKLRWQPIPAHYVPQQVDLLLKAFDMPKYRSVLTDIKKSSEFLEEAKKLTSLHDLFQSYGIDKIQKYGFFACMGIFNVLSVHRASNGKLPDWYTDELLENLRNRVAAYFDLMSLTPEARKWNIGPLVRRFADNMNVKEQVTNPRKIYLYSGHELNIAAYTRSHDIKEFRYPEYSSAVILEKLRDSQNKLYVRMLAWTGKDDKFTTLKLGKHEEFCPMEEYLKLIENVIPSDDEIDSMYEDVATDFKSLLTSDAVFKVKKVTTFNPSSATMG